MAHVVLLGDSVFDNAAYVDGGLSVSDHLRRELPPTSTVTLLAADGSSASGVPLPLPGIPAEAPHMVFSAGGNDAYNASPVLTRRVSSVTEAVELLAGVRTEFRDDYERLLAAVEQIRGPGLGCPGVPHVPEPPGAPA